MADALISLMSLTLILIAGIISIALSKRLKLPLPLLLFASGAVLGNIMYFGNPVIQLSGHLLSAFSILALIIIIFDIMSKIRFAHFDSLTKDSFKFFIISLILNSFFIAYLARMIFNLELFVSIIFALMISCIEYYAIYPKHHLPKSKVTEILKDESAISCAFILLIPFLIIMFLMTVNVPVVSFAQALPFIVNLLSGVGVGVIVSILLFKSLSYKIFDKVSSLLVAAAVMLSYFVSMQIDGNGLISVAAMGLIFANVFFRQKSLLRSRLLQVDSVIEILLLILAGIVVQIPFTLAFFKQSFGLFLVFLLIRFLSAKITLRKYDERERFEIAFFVPKGVATVTVAFALLNYSFSGVVLLTQLLMAFFVYSLVFDYILDRFGFYESR